MQSKKLACCTFVFKDLRLTKSAFLFGYRLISHLHKPGQLFLVAGLKCPGFLLTRVKSCTNDLTIFSYLFHMPQGASNRWIWTLYDHPGFQKRFKNSGDSLNPFLLQRVFTFYRPVWALRSNFNGCAPLNLPASILFAIYSFISYSQTSLLFRGKDHKKLPARQEWFGCKELNFFLDVLYIKTYTQRDTNLTKRFQVKLRLMHFVTMWAFL